MTQEQLGFELGITKSLVSAWKNGRETPSFRMLSELRRQLRHSLDELICGIGPMDASPERVVQGAADETSPAACNEKERAAGALALAPRLDRATVRLRGRSVRQSGVCRVAR